VSISNYVIIFFKILGQVQETLKHLQCVASVDMPKNVLKAWAELFGFLHEGLVLFGKIIFYTNIFLH